MIDQERGAEPGLTLEGTSGDGASGSSADPSDPYQRRKQTFPTLPKEMIDRLCAYGTEEDAPDGTILFQRGDRSVDFFLILAGRVEITEPVDEGEPPIVHVHEAGQFTGELDLFNDRKILVGGRTAGGARLVRVKREHFRRMMQAEPDVADIIMRAFILRRTGLIIHQEAGVSLLGPSNDADTLRVSRFLRRNGYPVRAVDPEKDPETARRLLRECGNDPRAMEHMPVVISPDGATVLKRPSNADVAEALGLTEAVNTETVYDVVVVGAGPSGLAAAVYAASEGLSTLVVEGEAPGGQAGTSSKIENYLGFPTGISGQALAGRAWVQGQKFGARFAVARPVESIDCNARPFRLVLAGGIEARANAVVLATGATYRKLDLPNYAKFENQGIHYAATYIEADLCSGSEVAIVGGGNSAGQAAVFMARYASHVHVLVRSKSLAASMSDYLIGRINSSPRITLHTHTEITALHGDRYLESVTWQDSETGQSETRNVRNVFVMIGARPNTDWLGGCVEMDEKGFVLTGADLKNRAGASPFATSQDGMFAVGDVRSGSVKRVASAVGEGSVSIQTVHRYLDRLRPRDAA